MRSEKNTQRFFTWSRDKKKTIKYDGVQLCSDVFFVWDLVSAREFSLDERASEKHSPNETKMMEKTEAK